MEAAGEPWETEWQVASEASGLYGGTIGFLIIAELAAFNLTLPHGLFGFSTRATVSALVILCSPLFGTLYPLFDKFSRRKNARDLTAAYLIAGRCPSCGATLASDAGVGPERVCPACHAAWRVTPTATGTEPARAKRASRDKKCPVQGDHARQPRRSKDPHDRFGTIPHSGHGAVGKRPARSYAQPRHRPRATRRRARTTRHTGPISSTMSHATPKIAVSARSPDQMGVVGAMLSSTLGRP